MRKFAAYLFIAAGVLIILYPKASQWYYDRQGDQLMAEWEEELEAGGTAQSQYDGLTDLFADMGNGEDVFDGDAIDESEASASLEPEASAVESIEPTATSGDAQSNAPSPTTTANTSKKSQQNVIARIKIPSIKLNLPVLEGATEKNLRAAAAHLKETAGFGEVGNAAVAAHRMRAKGKLFNRLNEVKKGDKVTIETKQGTYTYTVTGTSIVEPSDVSVLNYNNRDKKLTLITCDPVVDPTHRLIVHAEMSG
ncbi:class D sortase [Paenibacillus sp. J5C_2022]|uniref:class D sortase n=1 Tax=Paenibacillus sp. J5C2022 TaxID=2977129 RepID=UPI0021D342F0|nr:class D sortase [Paenibacillus sp. J5C2022]MCU6710436.1 class D sortase [Paenibacillus sp. J5C2022]